MGDAAVITPERLRGRDRECLGRVPGMVMNNDDDRAFFCAEIERLMDRLYGTALRLTRSSADAEDLVSETVVKAWAALGQLADRGSFEKWIFRILVNTFFSGRRRAREEPVAILPGEDADDGFSLFDKLHQPFLLWWGNPEQELINKLLREDLQAALDSLPECYRIVALLVYLQGHSYAEVAEIIDVPVGTVRSRLSRARSLLQRALWQHAQAAGLVSNVQGKEAAHD